METSPSSHQLFELCLVFLPVLILEVDRTPESTLLWAVILSAVDLASKYIYLLIMDMDFLIGGQLFWYYPLLLACLHIHIRFSLAQSISVLLDDGGVEFVCGLIALLLAPLTILAITKGEGTPGKCLCWQTDTRVSQFPMFKPYIVRTLTGLRCGIRRISRRRVCWEAGAISIGEIKYLIWEQSVQGKICMRTKTFCSFACCWRSGVG